MKILDVVDTSQVGTKHLQQLGTLPLQGGIGRVPHTQAIPQTYAWHLNTGQLTVTFPIRGGLTLTYNGYYGALEPNYASGMNYVLDRVSDDLSSRTTQLNLSFTLTYISRTNCANYADFMFCFRTNGTGAFSTVRFPTLNINTLTGVGLTVPVKVEIVVDRLSKTISLYATRTDTNASYKATASYAAYTTMTLTSICIGPMGASTSWLSTYPPTAKMAIANTYDNILFTERETQSDMKRHGIFNLATIPNVVDVTDSNYVNLNSDRGSPTTTTDLLTGRSSISIGQVTTNVILRSDLASDDTLSGKGSLVGMMLTADITNSQGKPVIACTSSETTVAIPVSKGYPFGSSSSRNAVDARIGQLMPTDLAAPVLSLTSNT